MVNYCGYNEVRFYEVCGCAYMRYSVKIVPLKGLMLLIVGKGLTLLVVY